MKNKVKVLLWSLVGGFSLVGMLVFAENVITIELDPTNTIQHIGSVKFKPIDDKGIAVTISKFGLGLSQIETEKVTNILLGTTDNKIKGSYSTILGGVGNGITGYMYNTIIAGASNSIDIASNGEGNTILGGVGNGIVGNSKFSTIAGGENNVVVGEESAIVGGKDNGIWGSKSAIVGSENSVTGNNSVAMGKKSKIQGNNSFLWTDSENDEVLTKDNVFAVVSRKGMVINSIAPNEHAQLTIGGPLVVSVNTTNDSNVVCGLGQGGGTMKTVSVSGQYCLCNCDGSGWNSMFGQGQCQSICGKEDIQPALCGRQLIRSYVDNAFTFSGACEFGEVVEGTGAYFVDKDDIVYWVCTTKDGASVECNSKGINIVNQ